MIDFKMLGEQSGVSESIPSETEKAEPATASGIAAEAEANRERILKGGKMSTRQRTAVVKAELSVNNIQAGESFLADNKAKPGVISLPSGVQYHILRAGQGRKPTDTSEVRCRYMGTLIDGSVFDKTDDTKPVLSAVTGFLPGLKEAVKLMSAGSKWQIVVPPQLAYGERGDRGVGPNAVLIFEMEILSVK